MMKIAELATEAEVASFLSLKRQTLAKWRCSGIGPDYVTIGRRTIRYRWDAIEQWIDEQTAA